MTLMRLLPTWVKVVTGGFVGVCLGLIIGIAIFEIRDAIRERRY